MMALTRRSVLAALVAQAGSISVLVNTSAPAWACLWGRWKIRCPNGHDDIVTQGTCQHQCETCGAQAFDHGAVRIVCPNGHATLVQTGTSHDQRDLLQSYKCPQDHLECRLD